MSDLYDADILEWSEHQAALLRRAAAGERVNDIDWLNVAEEIESLGKSDRRELRNRVETILVHLVKLQASPAAEPRGGWRATVLHQRSRLDNVLRDSPSLRRTVSTVIAEVIDGARIIAATSMGDYQEQPLADLSKLEYTAEQVLGPLAAVSDDPVLAALARLEAGQHMLRVDLAALQAGQTALRTDLLSIASDVAVVFRRLRELEERVCSNP